MQQYDKILSDRGATGAVPGGPVRAFLKAVKRDRRFARASHNSRAVLLPDGSAKGDDGEAGAGMAILRMPERHGLSGHAIVVSRWFGGTKLSGDRFRRIGDAVRHYLDHGETGHAET